MGYSEHGTTHKLSDIVKFNNKLVKEKEKSLSTNDNSKYLKDYQDCLQYHVATFFDNESTQLPRAELKSGGNAAKSITSRFKGGKFGRIRGNLQGKRVDFSARTVITSDPNNNVDELGVPLKIAMIVTYPEIVTDANIDYLRLLIKNGRSKYPGANFVENTSIIGPNGKPAKVDLGYKNEGIVLHKGWIVHRHLQNDDIVLFNRQPSLHKMSMMAHKVRVIENPDLITFRLNVTATTPYNADFDRLLDRQKQGA
jgi:DNA-directed RNA polymerase II subunit RPB1